MNHSAVNVRIRAGSVPEVREVRIYQGVLEERQVRALYQRNQGETTLGQPIKMIWELVFSPPYPSNKAGSGLKSCQ